MRPRTTSARISLCLLVATGVLAGCEGGGNDTAEPTVTRKELQQAGRDVDVQGHRGARGLRPESTLPAFETALDLGVDTLELDLHLTRDDRLVVWHDPFIVRDKCHVPHGNDDLPDPDRLAPGDPALWIRHLTAEQLSRYVCDRNPKLDFFTQQVPAGTQMAGPNFGIVTLETFFGFVRAYAENPDKPEARRNNAAHVAFDIETKRDVDHPEFIADGFDGQHPGPLEQKLVAVATAAGVLDRLTVQSFDARSLWAIRTIAPNVELSVLEKERSVPLKAYAARGATIWSPKYSLVDEKTMAEAHHAGLKVKPWTVDEPDEMVRLTMLGADGIITDRPDVLLELLGRLD